MSDKKSASEPLGARWAVRLFGPLRASLGARVIGKGGAETWPGRKAELLLVRLLLEPGVAHSRDELSEWLWPRRLKGRHGDDLHTWRRERLRHVLSDLNKLLHVPGLRAGAAIAGTRNALQVNAAAFRTDVQAFESLLAQGDVPAARACLQNGLLPDHADPWLDVQRERLRARLDAGERGTPSPFAQRRDAGLFFGRESDMERLRACLRNSRLVVITGPAGSGKTRLALRVLQDLAGFDESAFVALAEHAEPAQLFEQVRGALEIQAGALPALQQVVGRLSGQRSLLVLDRFERMAGSEGEAALQTLLDALPGVSLLVTSVRDLRLPGRAGLALAPLPVPEMADTVADAAKQPAVALFVARARDAHPSFRLNARNLAGVIATCRAVEGLPLAIELAARRVGRLTPRRIAAELQGGRVVPASARRSPRHASLEAVLDWTWRLLDDAQRAALMLLAVLRGDFTVEQARAMLDADVDMALLESLQRDSVLLRQPADAAAGPPRLYLLNAMREFVAARTPPALAASAAARHREWFASWALEADATRRIPDPADLQNLVIAGIGALQHRDAAPAALAIASCVARYALSKGAPPELLNFLQRAAGEIDPQTPGHAALRVALPRLFVSAGRAEAAQTLAAAALARAGSDAAARAEALFVHTRVRWLADRDGKRAMAPAQEALQLARDAGAFGVQAHVLLLLGALALTLREDVPAAEAHFIEAEALFTRLDDPHGLVLVKSALSACRLLQHKFREALDMAAEGHAQAAKLNDVIAQLQLCNRLSEALGGLERFDEALEVCRRELHLARTHGVAYQIAYGLWNQCLLRAILREPETAAMLMAFSQRYWQTQFGALDKKDRAYIERVRRRVTAQLDGKRWRSAWDRGLLLSDAEAIRLACG